MNFRERPEYANWRRTVVARFGDRCILCGYAGNNPNDFHRLMHIRNQFAHCNPKHHIHVYLDNERAKPSKVEAKLMLESLSSVGELVPVDTSEALQEFTEIYDRLRKYLLEISKLA